MNKIIIIIGVTLLFLGMFGCTTKKDLNTSDTNSLDLNRTIPNTYIPDTNTPDTNTPILGGDRDVHGCIPSAGYSWCSVKNKCMRPWEEVCAVDNNITDTNFVSDVTGDVNADYNVVLDNTETQ